MKKIFLTLLTIIVVCATIGLVACDGNGDTPQVPQITSISIISTKSEYYVDEFNYDDYTIKASFDNDTYKEIVLKEDYIIETDKVKLQSVGTHDITVEYEGKTAHFTVVLKNHDFNDLSFESVTETYNGEEHEITVRNVPQGATVTYDKENKYTEAGIYEITATVSMPNYNDKELTATLTITREIHTLTFR